MSGLPRLIASDLDGTLLGPGGALSPRTIAALRAADAAGVAVAAATGRSFRTAGPLVAPAGVVRYGVCSNGAVLVDFTEGVTLERVTMTEEVVASLFAALRAGLPGVGFAWETPFGFGADDAYLALRPDVLDPGRDPHGAPRSVHKVLVLHPDLRDEDLYAAAVPLAPAEVVVSNSGAAFVEVMAAGVSKAAGLASLCRRLGVDPADVVAFGDHRNDLAMLAWAGRGVAMGNAHADVLETADHVAGHHLDDGVAVHVEALLAGTSA